MKACVIQFQGTGGELELVDALANFDAVEVTCVDDQATDLSAFDVIFLPGGASHGDYLRPGAIAAITPVIEAVRKAAAADTLIIGIGNGFQILTEADLLPGYFVINETLNFYEGYETVSFENGELTLPVSSKYGQYVLDEKVDDKQVLLSYQSVSPFGQEASTIAGVSNEAGNVIGIMPHFERATQPWRKSQDGLVVLVSLLNQVTRIGDN